MNEIVANPEDVNSRIPVTQVLPEILVYIFQLVQATVKGGYQPVDPGWIWLTWVCRHWRAAALSTPVLWTSIVLRGPDTRNIKQAQTFLERASGALLEVTVVLNKQADEKMRADEQSIVSVLLPHASAIRRFELSVSGHLTLNDFLDPLLAHSSALEEFCLRNWRQDVKTILRIDCQKLVRLQTLKLDAAAIDWPTFTLPSLRSLMLERAHPAPSTDDIMRILAQSPSIEILSLNCSQGAAATIDHAPLSLMKLRHLEMFGSSEQMSYILEHVSVSASCSISTHTLFTTNQEHNALSVLVPKQLAYQEPLRQCNLIKLEVFLDMLCLHLEGPHAHVRVLRYEFYLEDSPLTPLSWKTLFGALASPRITRLEILNIPLDNVDENTWRACLSGFPQLQELTLSPAYCTLPQIEVIRPPLSSIIAARDASNAAPGPLCPRLRQLHFNGLGLTEEMVNEICTTLEQRASQGHPIEGLGFINCMPKLETTSATTLKERFERFGRVSIRYCYYCPKGCCEMPVNTDTNDFLSEFLLSLLGPR